MAIYHNKKLPLDNNQKTTKSFCSAVGGNTSIKKSHCIGNKIFMKSHSIFVNATFVFMTTY